MPNRTEPEVQLIVRKPVQPWSSIRVVRDLFLRMSSTANSTPLIPPDAQSSTPAIVSDGAASGRLEDRVAVFLQSLEGGPFEDASRSRFPLSVVPAQFTDAARLVQSTADPVHAQPQVFLLVDNERVNSIPHLISPDAMDVQHNRCAKLRFIYTCE